MGISEDRVIPGSLSTVSIPLLLKGGGEPVRQPPKSLPLERLCRNSTKPSFRASPASLPRTRYGVGRDPWFDRLTTLSEVEGESRKIAENQMILDLPPTSAGDDELRHSLGWRRASVGV